MRADTLKAWLQEKGCHFDSHSEDRGQGHASVTVRLGDRKSVLPMVGTHQDLKSEDVQKIVEELGLSAEDIPAHEEGEGELYKKW